MAIKNAFVFIAVNEQDTVEDKGQDGDTDECQTSNPRLPLNDIVAGNQKQLRLKSIISFQIRPQFQGYNMRPLFSYFQFLVAKCDLLNNKQEPQSAFMFCVI